MSPEQATNRRYAMLAYIVAAYGMLITASVLHDTLGRQTFGIIAMVIGVCGACLFGSVGVVIAMREWFYARGEVAYLMLGYTGEDLGHVRTVYRALCRTTLPSTTVAYDEGRATSMYAYPVPPRYRGRWGVAVVIKAVSGSGGAHLHIALFTAHSAGVYVVPAPDGIPNRQVVERLKPHRLVPQLINRELIRALHRAVSAPDCAA